MSAVTNYPVRQGAVARVKKARFSQTPNLLAHARSYTLVVGAARRFECERKHCADDCSDGLLAATLLKVTAGCGAYLFPLPTVVSGNRFRGSFASRVPESQDNCRKPPPSQ